jgi:ABC-type Mn2+/Zn2+ transport system permease subunit
MPGDPLGQLVASEIARPEVGSDHPGALQDREGTVERGDGDVVPEIVGQLGGGTRTVGAAQSRHHGGAVWGVARTVAGEPPPHLFVHACHSASSAVPLIKNDSHYKVHMEWLVDPFETAAQQRALIAGLLAALALAVVGTWVVIRGMTFLGDALAHGVIPGVALALLLDVSLLLGAAAAAVVMIGGIHLVHRQTAFSEDTGIGLLFVGMLALGVLIASRTEEESEHLEEVLFGDALAVGAGDVVVAAVVAAVTVAVAVLFHRAFLALAFNEQKAQVLGLRPALAHFTLLALLTIGIAGAFQTVGTLLVFGLLIGPAATAALVVRRVPVMMLVAASIGVSSVVIGLVVGHHAGVSPSAAMSLAPIALFFVVLGARSVPHLQARVSR